MSISTISSTIQTRGSNAVAAVTRALPKVGIAFGVFGLGAAGSISVAPLIVEVFQPEVIMLVQIASVIAILSAIPILRAWLRPRS